MPLKPPTHPINWPRGIRLTVYDENMLLIVDSHERQYDLGEELFPSSDERIVYLEVEVHSKEWHRWDKEALNWIENRIRWDLEYDGNEFSLRRHTRNRGHPCTEGFVWKIHVR